MKAGEGAFKADGIEVGERTGPWGGGDHIFYRLGRRMRENGKERGGVSVGHPRGDVQQITGLPGLAPQNTGQGGGTDVDASTQW